MAKEMRVAWREKPRQDVSALRASGSLPALQRGVARSSSPGASAVAPGAPPSPSLAPLEASAAPLEATEGPSQNDILPAAGRGGDARGP